MFGRNTNNISDGEYENIISNGITPYLTLRETIKGIKEFTIRAKKITKARLKIEIAETEQEALREFSDKDNLIIIAESEYFEFFGPFVEGILRAHHLPGTSLGNINYQTFHANQEQSAFERAAYLSGEVVRQMQCRSTLATFVLERL